MTASMLVLSAWAVVGAAVTLVMSSLKRKPESEPIAEELGEARP